MIRPAIAAAAAAAFAVCLTPTASAQSSGARNQAMGGAGVASANPWVAPFINPALMRHNREDHGFSFTLPFLGATAADPDELVDRVDELQENIDEIQERLNNADPTANDLRPIIANQLLGIDGRAVDSQIGAGTAFVFPFDGFSIGLSARTLVDARILPIVDPVDINTINNSLNPADFDNLSSEAVVAAAGVTEFGLSVASGFRIIGRDVTIGVTPKFQSVETYNYAVSVSDFEDDDALDDFDDDQFRDNESGFNVDVGAAIELNQNVTAGLSISNLISDSYDTVFTGGRNFTYKVEARPTVGVAFHGAGFTLTGDLDLLPTTRFEEVADSQFARFGAEYDLAGWAQLRGGLAIDLEDTQENVLSAGIGLSPFRTVRIDLVGQYADNTAGAGFQLGFSF